MPIVRQLKWSIQRDKLAQLIKGGAYTKGGICFWLQGTGRSVVKDDKSEKVRLAICPDIRRRIGFFEQLGYS